MPSESALRTEQRDQFTDEQLAEMGDSDGPHGPWSRDQMLLAAMFDALMTLIHVQLKRGGAEHVDPPRPIRRPGVIPPPAKKASPQQVAYLQRIRDMHDQQREAT